MKKKEENLYGINDREFDEILDITEEQINKHPDRLEKILMEFCHMMLRNEQITRYDAILLFSKKLGISELELFKKYHLKEDAMYLRNHNQKEFIKIKREERNNEI